MKSADRNLGMDRSISRRDLLLGIEATSAYAAMDYAELPGWDAAGLPDDDEDERYPHMRARKRFGNISIANADAASNAMLEAAVEQAHRAVTELLSL